MDPEKKSNGAFIGLVIIIVILIIGGIYVWNSKVKNGVGETSPTLSTQDTNDLNSLDQDVQSTNTNAGVDASTVY